jgi:hypothetical protein
VIAERGEQFPDAVDIGDANVVVKKQQQASWASGESSQLPLKRQICSGGPYQSSRDELRPSRSEHGLTNSLGAAIAVDDDQSIWRSTLITKVAEKIRQSTRPTVGRDRDRQALRAHVASLRHAASNNCSFC